MLKKYKKELLIFCSFFLAYFVLSLIYSYYLGTYKFWNVLFDIDTPRVFGDLTVRSYNHYRAAVHPLFVLLFQPITIILNIFTKESILSVLLLQSTISALSVVCFYSILKKLKLDNYMRVIFILLFGLNYGQIIFSSNVETYIFAQIFLLAAWAFAAYRMDKKLKLYDYIILVLLGVGSIAITLTNFIQFIIIVFFLLILNKKIKKRYLNAIIVMLLTISIAVLLADIQNIIWPSAPNFFTKNINDFIYGTSEENLYIDTTISFSKLLNVINSNFAHLFNMSNLVVPDTGGYITFKPSIITNIVSIVCFISFVGLNVYYIIRSKFNIEDNKLYYGLLATYIINFVFHIFYGNSICFLYICHYNYIILLLIAYIVKKLNIDRIKNKVLYIITTLIILASSLRMCILTFIKLYPQYNVIEHFRMLPLIIILILAILIILLSFKNNKLKLLFIVLIGISLLIGWKYINTDKKCDSKCDEFERSKIKLEKYTNQLKDMKNSFSVNTYSKVEKPIGIYYFGMADRRKMLYKKGKLVDAKTKELIKKIDYKDELIVPNEYMVILRDEGNNIYKIVEDEEGIIFYKNGEKEILSAGYKDIKLPKFKGKKYSEILKVLHQEILFNIDGDVPKPNIFGYNSAWYRDTMLATMVLEDTDNTMLLENWVNSIKKVYDNSRDENIDEADNLGELLYILGAVNNDKSLLVNKILNEIQSLKNEKGYISGMVDGTIQTYYPTVLAIYGARKNNIDLDLMVPEVDDGYAKLTWYYDVPIASKSNQTSKYYPYINWAFYHYSNYGSLYILDELYPLSYEGGNTSEPGRVESECFISKYYCSRNLYISHMWHASEMYLMLKNY